MNLRSADCAINEDTKRKLLDHADELKTFGVTIEETTLNRKSADTQIALIGLVLLIAESFRSGVLRDLVRYLRDLDITEEQILRLRLDEPQKISAILGEKPERKSLKGRSKKQTVSRKPRTKKKKSAKRTKGRA